MISCEKDTKLRGVGQGAAPARGLAGHCLAGGEQLLYTSLVLCKCIQIIIIAVTSFLFLSKQFLSQSKSSNSFPLILSHTPPGGEGVSKRLCGVWLLEGLHHKGVPVQEKGLPEDGPVLLPLPLLSSYCLFSRAVAIVKNMISLVILHLKEAQQSNNKTTMH